MPTRNCAVSFADVRGIRHVEVQAESLFEAAILDVRRLKSYPCIEHVGRRRCWTEVAARRRRDPLGKNSGGACSRPASAAYAQRNA